MDKRLYPITLSTFNKLILPIIEGNYIWKGRPPIISHYRVFCGILYILRTGIPWRDLPKCFGNWHNVYMRFQRGAEKNIWWYILMSLQKQRRLKMNIVICDSTSFKYHRHGGGQKGGSNQKEEVYQD
jgi:transposase